MRLAALLLILVACSSSAVTLDATLAPVDAVPDVAAQTDTPDAGGAQPCTAGRVEECPCGDGRRGTQTCQPSGSYGPCVCADAAVAVPDVVTPAPDVRPADVGCLDFDLDGFGPGCAFGPDCNDNDRTVHPGATEICDGVDQNCDGNLDVLTVAPGQPPYDPAVNAYCEGLLQPDGGAWEVTPRCVVPSIPPSQHLCSTPLAEPTCVACTREGARRVCYLRSLTVVSGRCGRD